MLGLKKGINMSEVKKMSGLAITSMVIGIVAVALSWVPIINNVAGVASMVGFVLAIPAMISTCKKKTKRGSGFAIAGLVTNVLAFAIMWYTQSVFAFILS